MDLSWKLLVCCAIGVCILAPAVRVIWLMARKKDAADSKGRKEKRASALQDLEMEVEARKRLRNEAMDKFHKARDEKLRLK